MSLATLKTTLEGLTGKQKRMFNQVCTSKLYNEATASLTTAEQDEVDAAQDEVNNLSSNDLEDLIVMLASTRKLSKRPC